MQFLAIILLLIGLGIGLWYGIQLIIIAFQESVWWGLAYLFIPFAAWIFLFMYWDEAQYPFIRSLMAIPFFLLGFFLMPAGGLG